MSTKVKGDKIKEGSIPLSALDDKLEAEINSKYGLSGIVCILNSNNTVSDTFIIGEYFVYVSSKKEIIKLPYDGQVDLSRLGGPSTIIKCEVINGSKIKFSVSGEGISYYGNLIIGNKYNDVPIPTPDWNAAYGKAGYIKNKPFDTAIFKGVISNNRIGFSSLDPIYGLEDGKLVLELINDNVSKQFTPGVEETWETYWGGAYLITATYDGRIDLVITCDESPESLSELLDDIICYTPIKRIDDTYLPNTVLKTTPQTLSDTDKNQALANLGIDPVVWKYLCNPCIIREGEAIPVDLLNSDGEFNITKYAKCPSMFRLSIDSGELINVEYDPNNDTLCGNGALWFSDNGTWTPA